MNKNKIIALLIILAVFFGPFGMLFCYNGDVVVNSVKEIFLFLAWLGGLIAAFYISVNQPFGKEKAHSSNAGTSAASLKKAA